MRLPLTLLIFTISSLALAGQQPFHTQSVTIVDALSRDEDFTSCLRLFQKARLIPTLNRLNGSTLFAPTNEAIASSEFLSSLALDDSVMLHDNVQEQLRQQLFYHMLNYTIPSLPQAVEQSPAVHRTLLFPHSPRELPNIPSWFPVPRGTLGTEPQRLRLAVRGEKRIVWVGVDAFGEGGVEIVKDKVSAVNGVIFGINRILVPPPDLEQIISKLPQVSFFNKVLTPDISRRLNVTEELTIFIPTDAAFSSLDPFEKLYLESPYAADDVGRILNMHALVQDGTVKYSDSFIQPTSLTTMYNTTMEVSQNKIVISPETTAEITHPDIYASNGVLHIISSPLIPPGALQITPEKYLLTLNCTKLVSLIHESDLTFLINDTSTKYTILAPSDEILSVYGDQDLPEAGSEDLKRMLKYHFLPGKWSHKKLVDGLLVETELREDGLAGSRQVLDVKKHDKSLTFGGVGVITGPIEVGNNTIIYFISRPLVPPSDALQTALPILDVSSFLAAVFSTSIADRIKTTPQTSFLIPYNSAFKRLGVLVVAHLLSTSGKSDLEQVLLHHVLSSVEYSSTLGPQGSQHTFATLQGTDLQLDRRQDGLVLSASGGWTGMKSELDLANILTSTGVLHFVSDILLPRSVELDVGKLVKAAQGTIMLNLVNKAGLGWILNGTAPPEGSRWENMNNTDWTLLCPRDEAFRGINLTELASESNREVLQNLIGQHIIPSSSNMHTSQVTNNDRPLLLKDSATYSTLLSPSSVYGDIIFREREDKLDTYIVGIQGTHGKEGREDWAEVLAWGRTTTGGGVGGVIQISRLLTPYNPRWTEYGGPALLLVGGIIAICGFFAIVRLIWRIDVTVATYAPVGGFANDEED